jgi:hypothetical protein
MRQFVFVRIFLVIMFHVKQYICVVCLLFNIFFCKFFILYFFCSIIFSLFSLSSLPGLNAPRPDTDGGPDTNDGGPARVSAGARATFDCHHACVGRIACSGHASRNHPDGGGPDSDGGGAGLVVCGCRRADSFGSVLSPATSVFCGFVFVSMSAVRVCLFRFNIRELVCQGVFFFLLRFIDNALVGYAHRHFFFFSDGPFRVQ